MKKNEKKTERKTHKSLRIDSPSGKLLRRFIKYVKLPEDQSQCWEWQGCLSSTTHGSGRYGQFCYQGETHGAHRISHCIFNGPIPEGYEVMHKCNNPQCVNPDHLKVGTHRENMLHAIETGVWVPGSPRKVSDEDVAYIKRELLKSGRVYGTSAKLARQFGVSPVLICHIKSGKLHSNIAPLDSLGFENELR